MQFTNVQLDEFMDLAVSRTIMKAGELLIFDTQEKKTSLVKPFKRVKGDSTQSHCTCVIEGEFSIEYLETNEKKDYLVVVFAYYEYESKNHIFDYYQYELQEVETISFTDIPENHALNNLIKEYKFELDFLNKQIHKLTNKTYAIYTMDYKEDRLEFEKLTTKKDILERIIGQMENELKHEQIKYLEDKLSMLEKKQDSLKGDL